MPKVNTLRSERRAKKKALRSNITPLTPASRTSRSLPKGMGETGTLALADQFVLAVAYNTIMDQPPRLRMYSDAWDMGEMLLGEQCWRGGLLLEQQARPIALAAAGRNDPHPDLPDVFKYLAEDEGRRAELQAVITSAKQRHITERELQKQWLVEFDASPEGEPFLEANPVPMFTAIKWVFVGEKAEEEKAA